MTDEVLVKDAEIARSWETIGRLRTLDEDEKAQAKPYAKEGVRLKVRQWIEDKL
jgi:hypothetical protein